MAKNIGVVQYSGKLGNTVGATKSAGQKANTIRIKPTSVKNPQSEAQILQRIRVRGASNIYTALGGILDHSFQGVEYGAPSHNHFMKLAMTDPGADMLPVYISKSNNRPLPFKFEIASGTAPSVNFGIENNKAYIVVENAATLESDMETAFLPLYDLKEGDYMTIVACIASGLEVGGEINFGQLPYANVRFMYKRIAFSPEAVMEDSFEEFSPSITNGKLSLTFGTGVPVAFAVIVSRKHETPSGDVTFERSNTTLTLNSGWQEILDDSMYREHCIDTYKKKKNTSDSPWYLNGGSL